MILRDGRPHGLPSRRIIATLFVAVAVSYNGTHATTLVGEGRRRIRRRRRRPDWEVTAQVVIGYRTEPQSFGGGDGVKEARPAALLALIHVRRRWRRRDYRRRRRDGGHDHIGTNSAPIDIGGGGREEDIKRLEVVVQEVEMACEATARLGARGGIGPFVRKTCRYVPSDREVTLPIRIGLPGVLIGQRRLG